MARLTNRLTVRAVQTIQKSGLHADGGGLFLSTTNNGRRWVFIFRWQGRRREMGLGSARNVSLAQAREAARNAQALLADGRNPIEARQAEREAASREEPETTRPTFAQFTDSYISSVEGGWKNAVHRKQWRNSLRDHASSLSSKPIAEISTDDLLSVLQPIWLTKSETANRVRGRIEKILSAAKARGLRERDSANPALWRGHLDVLLPKRPKMARGHHPAMPYKDLPRFVENLASRPAVAARALEFLILNASRTGEVLGARWDEISGDLWTIPAERMKAGLAHSVPLSPAALKILDGLERGRSDDFVFGGQKPGSPLSNMSMEMLLRRMGASEYTVHGFRSSFKDWAADCTEFPDEISEEALAHIVGSKVRRAYRRGEALDRRRRLMSRWADFVANVALPSPLKDKVE